MATTRTLQQIIILGLQELGVAAAGEPVDSEYLLYGILKFNDLVDQLAAYRLTVWELKRQTSAIAAGATSYTVGTGATINIPRPEQILRAGLLNTNVSASDPLETPIHMYSDEEWARIGRKTLESNIAWGAWYQRAVPNGILFIHPILTVAQQIALYVPLAMAEVTEDETGLATSIVTPPGYRKMFATQMALEMADYFKITPSNNLMRKAVIAMDFVCRANATPMTLRLPRSLSTGGARRGFNIKSNGY